MILTLRRFSKFFSSVGLSTISLTMSVRRLFTPSRAKLLFLTRCKFTCQFFTILYPESLLTFWCRIVFMREFRVIGSATSVDQLNQIVQGKDKAYGDPLTPNFLYDEMKRSKWFATLEVSI